MLSWDALNPSPIEPAGVVSRSFLSLFKTDLRAAAEYVCKLPYGRNLDPRDPLIVFTERRGTCSTKHALIRRLAIEQKLNVALVLGIYKMTGANTPGVGATLQKHGLADLLEAHCYLRADDRCIDITRPPSGLQRSAPIGPFLHEEEIDPSQITDYKIQVHKRFLKQWMDGKAELADFSFEQIWAIREECIAQLSG